MKRRMLTGFASIPFPGLEATQVHISQSINATLSQCDAAYSFASSAGDGACAFSSGQGQRFNSSDLPPARRLAVGNGFVVESNFSTADPNTGFGGLEPAGQTLPEPTSSELPLPEFQFPFGPMPLDPIRIIAEAPVTPNPITATLPSLEPEEGVYYAAPEEVSDERAVDAPSSDSPEIRVGAFARTQMFSLLSAADIPSQSVPSIKESSIAADSDQDPAGYVPSEFDSVFESLEFGDDADGDNQIVDLPSFKATTSGFESTADIDPSMSTPSKSVPSKSQQGNANALRSFDSASVKQASTPRVKLIPEVTILEFGDANEAESSSTPIESVKKKISSIQVPVNPNLPGDKDTEADDIANGLPLVEPALLLIGLQYTVASRHRIGSVQDESESVDGKDEFFV